MFMIDEENSEEAKKKLEEARRIRNSVGMYKSDELEKGTEFNTSFNINSKEYKDKMEEARRIRHSVGMYKSNELENSNTTIRFDVNSKEYQDKMEEARRIRHSVGMYKTDELEKEKNEAINMNNNPNIRGRKNRSSK